MNELSKKEKIFWGIVGGIVLLSLLYNMATPEPSSPHLSDWEGKKAEQMGRSDALLDDQ